MRKVITFALTVVLLFALAVPACADFDLSGLSLEELVALKDQHSGTGFYPAIRGKPQLKLNLDNMKRIALILALAIAFGAYCFSGYCARQAEEQAAVAQ